MVQVECLELVFLTVTCIIGNTKARVLPLPVGAEQHISRVAAGRVYMYVCMNTLISVEGWNPSS